MKKQYKQGDILRIGADNEHFSLMWAVFENYIKAGACIDILKTKGIVKEFNNIRDDWMNAALMIYPDLKGCRYSIGCFGHPMNVTPYESTIKIVVTGIEEQK